MLLPQEITGLGQDRELVILENLPPILAPKIVYYKSHDFMDRLKEVSASLDQLGHKLPNQKQLDEAIVKGELASSVPMINLEEHHQHMEGQNQPITVTAPQQTVTEMVKIEREATVDDIPQLQTRSLDGYALEFTDIPIPQKGDLNETGLYHYAKGLALQTTITF